MEINIGGDEPRRLYILVQVLLMFSSVYCNPSGV